MRTHAPAQVLEELRTTGFALLEAGCWSQVENALRSLPQAVRRDDAIVVCLRAQLEAQAGALTRANDLFERACRVAQTTQERAAVSRERAVHCLNQGDTAALAAIEPALDAGSEIDRIDASGIHAMALALTGSFEPARDEIRVALDGARAIDDEHLLARTLHRASYVEYQGGDVGAAQRLARDSAHLAHGIGAWFHFLCAHSIMYGAAASNDDHAAALWHAQQMGFAAERTLDRRHRLYAASAQYVLEVERGRIDRALALESSMPTHSSGFRDELDVHIALAIRKSWDGAFFEGYRQLAALDDRVVDPSERKLLHAALAMFAALGGDERGAAAHLRRYGKPADAVARENAHGNAQGACYAAIAQVLLGHPGRAVRWLPHRAPTAQTRALTTFVREIAELGPSLGRATGSEALRRLRLAGQEGVAQALDAALSARGPQEPAIELTAAERRVLTKIALGMPADAIAREYDRSIHTVRNQIKSVTRKLGASGSIEAVARAKRLGLID
ncbi:MAG TPA: LuxR C-terminal-related transcriptional regulator [Candidatus Acidoferrales bacterium]|nr:LuxR C-terminal-related transcriptional regulator [Candidatus Acidoferrales bacterium]